MGRANGKEGKDGPALIFSTYIPIFAWLFVTSFIMSRMFALEGALKVSYTVFAQPFL